MNRQDLVKKIDRASFKQVFTFLALLPASLTFPVAYLLSPTAQQNLTNIPITVMVFVAWICMWLAITGFSMVVYRDYVVYSPRVYNRISNETYLALAKNKFLKEIIDLFVSSTEKKLTTTWNQQTIQVAQNTENIEGLKARVTNIENTHSVERKEWQEKEMMYLNRISTVSRQLDEERQKNAKLEKEKSEKIQTIGDKAKSNVNNENTDLKKFKDLDE